MGCGQKYQINYENTFSPVLKSDTLRSLISYAIQENYDINHYDVETAFLYSNLNETIYMEQPEGYKQISESGETLYCKLNRAIYGLKQASKAFYDTIKDVLLTIGFKNFKADKCVFDFNDKNSRVIIGIYVDDLIVISTDKKILKHVIDQLNVKFKIKDVSGENNFLGIELKRNKNGIVMTQQKYIDEILKRFNMTDCHGMKTPMDPNVKFEQYEGSKQIDKTLFQEIIGSIMYLATKTRPDLCYSVTALSRYNHDPRELHLTGAKRLLRYIKETRTQGLVYTNNKNNALQAYCDASWRCGHGSEKSISGFVYMSCDNVISWMSKSQQQTALSSCDSEVAALVSCAKKGIFLDILLNELSGRVLKPINIFVDNQAAIILCNSGCSKEKSQHLTSHLLYVRKNNVG